VCDFSSDVPIKLVVKFYIINDSTALAHPAVGDNDFLAGFSRLGSEGLDLLDNIHALDNLAKHNVLAIKPLGLGGTQEELTAIGVGSSVGHRKDSRSGVLELEVLVLELVSVDRLSTGSVVVGEVTALAHEVRDHTMEGRSLEPVALLSGAQGTEVLRGLGHNVLTQLHDNSSHGGAISGDIEECAYTHLGEFRLRDPNGFRKNL